MPGITTGVRCSDQRLEGVQWSLVLPESDSGVMVTGWVQVGRFHLVLSTLMVRWPLGG